MVDGMLRHLEPFIVRFVEKEKLVSIVAEVSGW